MRYLFNVISLFLLVAVTSCTTVKIDQEQRHKTKHQKILGTIGEQKNFILDKDYNSLAIPHYKKEIPLVVKSVPFNTATFKAFSEAKTAQNSSIKINYLDSLDVKPKFITLDIANRVLVLEQLKSNKNKAVYDFLLHKDDAQMVINLALVFNTEDTKHIEMAEAVVLKSTAQQGYELALYTNHKVTHTISFKNAVIFGYQISNFCWKQTSSHKLKLVDLVETNDKCPKGSYRSAKRAKKQINHYKL